MRVSAYYRDVMAGFAQGARNRRSQPDAKRGFLVGQAAPRPVPGTTHHPLFPFPKNCAGERLFRMSGWTLEEWFTKLDRFNTIERFPGKSGRGDAFPKDVAMAEAQRHFGEKKLWGKVCVIVGKANADCYAWHGDKPEPLTLVKQSAGGWWGWMPHTSGIVQFWNKEENRDRARLFFDQVKIQLE